MVNQRTPIYEKIGGSPYQLHLKNEKMKHTSITIALALFATIANAQNITGSHQVRVDDEVKKLQVEYDDVDTKGQDVVIGTERGTNLK